MVYEYPIMLKNTVVLFCSHGNTKMLHSSVEQLIKDFSCTISLGRTFLSEAYIDIVVNYVWLTFI